MNDEEYTPPDNEPELYNQGLNEAAQTPFQKSTSSTHSMNISEKRWKEIFGHG
jgi:uncharacterized protein (DUF2164 family)